MVSAKTKAVQSSVDRDVQIRITAKRTMSNPTDKMTRTERSELGQLIRKRERVLKTLAAERSAQMLAEFDSQLSKIYSFDQDEIWEKSVKEAEKVVREANKVIAQRSKELGIPKEFAPSVAMGWIERGQNEVAGRRRELRQAAKSRIAALEAEAKSKIERMSLDAQSEVIASGLESAAARAFLERMPGIETLMPTLNVAQIKQLQDAKRKKSRAAW